MRSARLPVGGDSDPLRRGRDPQVPHSTRCPRGSSPTVARSAIRRLQVNARFSAGDARGRARAHRQRVHRLLAATGFAIGNSLRKRRRIRRYGLSLPRSWRVPASSASPESCRECRQGGATLHCLVSETDRGGGCPAAITKPVSPRCARPVPGAGSRGSGRKSLAESNFAPAARTVMAEVAAAPVGFPMDNGPRTEPFRFWSRAPGARDCSWRGGQRSASASLGPGTPIGAYLGRKTRLGGNHGVPNSSLELARRATPANEYPDPR